MRMHLHSNISSSIFVEAIRAANSRIRCTSAIPDHTPTGVTDSKRISKYRVPRACNIKVLVAATTRYQSVGVVGGDSDNNNLMM